MEQYKNFLHILPGASSAGSAKLGFPKGSHIAFMGLSLAIGCLPRNLSKEEFERCKEMYYVDFGEQLNIFGADLSLYDGVIVWHSNDVDSMLIFAMMCALFDGNLYHCNVSETFRGWMVGNLPPEELRLCADKIKRVSASQKKRFATLYSELPSEIRCAKQYSKGKFSIVDEEIIKQRIFKQIKRKPMHIERIVNEICGRAKLNQFYPSYYYEHLIAEMAYKGEVIISHMQLEKTEYQCFPYFLCFKQSYIYNGFDLRELYDLMIFKP